MFGLSITPLQIVSTHSHPKVAAQYWWTMTFPDRFQHTATRRWLRLLMFLFLFLKKFQHTATRRWLRYSVHSVTHYHQFQHTATRRWLRQLIALKTLRNGFNTQPPEGGCYLPFSQNTLLGVSTHSHPKVAANCDGLAISGRFVSTHSHPKVAALNPFLQLSILGCFNTQPPEGGC